MFHAHVDGAVTAVVQRPAGAAIGIAIAAFDHRLVVALVIILVAQVNSTRVSISQRGEGAVRVRKTAPIEVFVVATA